LHITFDEARKIQAMFEIQPPPAVPVPSIDYAKRVVRPFIDSVPELALVWRELTSLEKRAVTALTALNKRAKKEDTPLCPDAATATWPPPHDTGPMLVWNTNIGMGFVGPGDTLDGHKAHVWLWRSRRYRRKIYDLGYWRGLVGCNLEAVQDMERLAFPDPQMQSRADTHGMQP
jgi:hypothetical protein